MKLTKQITATLIDCLAIVAHSSKGLSKLFWYDDVDTVIDVVDD